MIKRITVICGICCLLIGAMTQPAQAYDEFDSYQTQSDQASRLSIKVSLFPENDSSNLLIGIQIGVSHSDSSTVGGMLRSTAHWMKAVAVRSFAGAKR